MKIVTVGSRVFVTSSQLAGIQGIVVETPDAALDEIKKLTDDSDVGLILVSDDISNPINDQLTELRAEKSVDALVAKGVSKEKIILALPTKVGEVGDYMAMLWMPPNPDHIKIQKITKVEQVEPEGMVGLWKGVSKDDESTIPL